MLAIGDAVRHVDQIKDPRRTHGVIRTILTDEIASVIWHLRNAKDDLPAGFSLGGEYEGLKDLLLDTPCGLCRAIASGSDTSKRG